MDFHTVHIKYFIKNTHQLEALCARVSQQDFASFVFDLCLNSILAAVINKHIPISKGRKQAKQKVVKTAIHFASLP